MSERRTEADLRAAFALAAQDAPSTQDVLARLDASEQPRPQSGRRRSWWPIAAVAAAVVVIAVPIGVAISHGGGSNGHSSSLSFGSAEAKGAAPAQSSASAAGSDIGGPVNGTPYVVPAVPTPAPSAGRVCTPADLTLALAWTKDGARLTGVVTATNHTSAACDLAVKPSIYPLDSQGNRLPVSNVVTAEGYAGPSRLMPGASATSTVTWSNWCGTRASATTQIDWGTAIATVVATGPTAPACSTGAPNTIGSSWFGPLS